MIRMIKVNARFIQRYTFLLQLRIVFWLLKTIDQLIAMDIFINVLFRISSYCQFFSLFQLLFNKTFNDQLFRQRRRFIKWSIFLTWRNNWWRRISRNSFKSREKKLWIIMIKANQRIARKVYKRKSTYIFFEN